MKPKVAVILGSKSDLKTAEPCLAALKAFDVPYELRICSAHRAPRELSKLIDGLEQNGAQIFIGVAGGAAHLPGVIASQTTKPVIGVPVASSPLGGQDALYSIAQMPGGIPVACVAIGEAGAKNAALLAIEILAVGDQSLQKKLGDYRTQLREKVLSDDKSVSG